MHTVTAAAFCLLLVVGLSRAQSSTAPTTTPSTTASTTTVPKTTTAFSALRRSTEATAINNKCTPLLNAGKCAKQLGAIAQTTADTYCGKFNELVGCLAAECDNYSSTLKTDVEAHRKKYNCNSAPRVLMASISVLILAVIGSFAGSKF